jgi:hypothetical protein
MQLVETFPDKRCLTKKWLSRIRFSKGKRDEETVCAKRVFLVPDQICIEKEKGRPKLRFSLYFSNDHPKKVTGYAI